MFASTSEGLEHGTELAKARQAERRIPHGRGAFAPNKGPTAGTGRAADARPITQGQRTAQIQRRRNARAAPSVRLVALRRAPLASATAARDARHRISRLALPQRKRVCSPSRASSRKTSTTSVRASPAAAHLLHRRHSPCAEAASSGAGAVRRLDHALVEASIIVQCTGGTDYAATSVRREGGSSLAVSCRGSRSCWPFRGGSGAACFNRLGAAPH